MIRLSIILATVGRDSLGFAASCVARQLRPTDEFIIAGGGAYGRRVAAALDGTRWMDLPAGGNWGHAERNAAMVEATGTHLLFVDDDDAVLPGALKYVRAALEAEPDRPHIFKMLNVDGRLLPTMRIVREGNLGTPQLVAPNVAERLGQWGTRYEGDFDYIASTLEHYPNGPIWHDIVIYACREHGRRAWGHA